MSEDSVIGIIMATHLEAEPFIKGFSLRQSGIGPFPVYENSTVRLIISGIGKANAAMASAYLALKFHLSGIYNLGAAGAADSGYSLGECFHITKVVEPDRPDLKSGRIHEHVPETYQGFPTAILATQDRPVIDALERRTVSLHAQLVDMEGAAVVQTCARFRSKCYLFKFVSDTSDDDDQSFDIEKNIEQYREDFYKFFCKSVLPRLWRS